MYEHNEVHFCPEYACVGVKYCCHPNFGNRGAYYDWMLVLYKDNKQYLCKLIACIPGSLNKFDGNHLIVQSADRKAKSQSVLFKDYKFSSEFIKIDANSVDGPCFVVESNPDKNIVSLAVDNDKWADKFTLNYNQEE